MLVVKKQSKNVCDFLEQKKIDTDFIQSDSGLLDAVFLFAFDENKKELRINIESKAPFMEENLREIQFNFCNGFCFAKSFKVNLSSELKIENSDFINDFILEFYNQEYKDNESYKEFFNSEIKKEKTSKNIRFEKYDKRLKKQRENARLDKDLQIVNDIMTLNKEDFELIYQTLI